jgi:MFS family permease
MSPARSGSPTSLGGVLRSPLGVLLLTVFIDLIGFGIVIPVLPLYAEKFGASPFTIGALMGVYSAMTFVFSPLLGKLSDRFGRRPVLLFSLIGSAAGFVVMGAARALWLLFAARLIDGASGGNISTAQAYLADITPPEGRARAMGFIGAAFGLGFILGPALGGTMSVISLSAPFYLAAAMAATNAVMVYVRLPESLAPENRSKPREKTRIADVFRHSRGPTFGAVLATYYIGVVGFALMTTLYALFTKHRFGYDAIHTGYLLAFLGVIGATIQGGLLGRLVARFGERPLATVGTAVLAASLFCLPLTDSLATLLLASAGIAVGNSFMTPTLNALASKSVDASWQGRALGLMQSSGSLGRLCGPLLAGWLLTFDVPGAVARYGRTPFWTAGAIMLGALALTLVIRRTDRAETAYS